MKPKFSWITWVLSGATVIAIVTEIIGAIVGIATNDDTKDTWTELITYYIPWEAQIAIYGLLVAWLPFHFYRNRKQQIEEIDEQVDKEANELLDYLKRGQHSKEE